MQVCDFCGKPCHNGPYILPQYAEKVNPLTNNVFTTVEPAETHICYSCSGKIAKIIEERQTNSSPVIKGVDRISINTLCDNNQEIKIHYDGIKDCSLSTEKNYDTGPYMEIELKFKAKTMCIDRR